MEKGTPDEDHVFMYHPVTFPFHFFLKKVVRPHLSAPFYFIWINMNQQAHALMHAGLFNLCIINIVSFGEKLGHILEPLYLLMYATLLASSISPVDMKSMPCNHTPLDL